MKIKNIKIRINSFTDLIIVFFSLIIAFFEIYQLFIKDVDDFRINPKTNREKIIGELEEIFNEVKRQSVFEIFWSKIKKNDDLYNQDKVFTGSDSAAKIKLSDGTDINLSPMTLIVLSMVDNDSRIYLQKGSVAGIIGKRTSIQVKDNILKNDQQKGVGELNLSLNETHDKLNINVIKGGINLESEGQEDIKILANEQVEIEKKELKQKKDQRIFLRSPQNFEVFYNHQEMSFSYFLKLSLDKLKNSEDYQLKILIAKDQEFNRELYQQEIDQVVADKEETISLNLKEATKSYGIFYWKIILLDKKNNKEILASDSFNFIMKRIIPLSPIYPKEEIVIETKEGKDKTNVLFQWDRSYALEKEGKTLFELSTTSDFSDDLIKEEINSSTYERELAHGRYFWRIKDLSEKYPAFWSESSLFLIKKKLVMSGPVLSSPENGFVFEKEKEETIEIDFVISKNEKEEEEEVNKTVNTQLIVAKDNQFREVLLNQEVAKDRFKVKKISSGHYFWKAINISNQTKKSVSSEIFSFEVLDPSPDIKILQMKRDNGRLVLTVTAEKSRDTDHYLIEIGKDSNFEQKEEFLLKGKILKIDLGPYQKDYKGYLRLKEISPKKESYSRFSKTVDLSDVSESFEEVKTTVDSDVEIIKDDGLKIETSLITQKVDSREVMVQISTDKSFDLIIKEFKVPVDANGKIIPFNRKLSDLGVGLYHLQIKNPENEKIIYYKKSFFIGRKIVLKSPLNGSSFIVAKKAEEQKVNISFEFEPIKLERQKIKLIVIKIDSLKEKILVEEELKAPVMEIRLGPGEYKWKARLIDQDFEEFNRESFFWSDNQNFRIKGAKKVSPPELISEGRDLSILCDGNGEECEFHFTDVLEASSYFMEISQIKVGGKEDILYSDEFKKTLLFKKRFPLAKNYKIKLASLDKEGVRGEINEYNFEFKLAPPKMITPEVVYLEIALDQNLDDISIEQKIIWEKTKVASNYEIIFSNNSNLLSSTKMVTKDNFLVLKDILFYSSYFYKIRSLNSKGEPISDYSKVQMFEVRPKVLLDQPRCDHDLEKKSNNEFELQIECKEVKDATKYEIVISKDEKMKQIVFKKETDLPKLNFVTREKTVYYSVIAKYKEFNSKPSVIMKVNVSE